MRLLTGSIAVLCVMCAGIVHAGDRYVILIPLLVGNWAGAHGSQWSSELTIHNAGLHEVHVNNSYILSAVAYWRVPSGGIVRISNTKDSGFPGQFVDVSFTDPQGRPSDVSFALRAYDTTRSDDWGTRIPVVRWDLLTSEELRFIDVPNDSAFRHTIRIYTEQGPTSAVSIDYFDMDDGRHLLSISPSFRAGGTVLHGEAYAQVDSSKLDLPFAQRLRIDVKNLRPGKPIWGMVSVTHNHTQRVTIISPHPATPQS